VDNNMIMNNVNLARKTEHQSNNDNKSRTVWNSKLEALKHSDTGNGNTFCSQTPLHDKM